VFKLLQANIAVPAKEALELFPKNYGGIYFS